MNHWHSNGPSICRRLGSSFWRAKGNWFPDFPRRDTFGSEEAWVEKVLDSVQGAMSRADTTIDELLAAQGLTDSALVLGGFSQGAAVSAYTGLRRSCLGVLPMGGPCPPRPQLLPDNSNTRVCIITGDRDPAAPHELIAESFAKYASQSESDGVHIIPGLNHCVTTEHVKLGLAFLQSCGCE